MAKTTRAKKKAETKAAKNAVKKDVLSSLKPKQKEIPIQQDSIRLLQFTYQSKAAVNSKTIQAAGEQLLQNAQAKIAEFGLSCLNQAFRETALPRSINLPHLLKRKLGLTRTAMVPVSKLPMLSQILKVELNVVGDVEQHHNQAKDGVYTK
eukprot:gene6789-10178_t